MSDHKPSGQIFILHGAPFLVSRGWIWKRHADGGWYSAERLYGLEYFDHICTPEETALYGVDYSEDIHGD